MWFSVSSAKQVLWSRSLPWLFKELKESRWLLVPHFLQRTLLEKYVNYARNCHLCGQICIGHIDFTANSSDDSDRWDESSQDKILLWNCWCIKMGFVLMHGYSTIKQIVVLWIMKNCLFELAFMIFSLFSALYSASLHQDFLQQLPSCTVFDSSPLTVLSVLNSTWSCSCHPCSGAVFKWGE